MLKMLEKLVKMEHNIDVFEFSSKYIVKTAKN